jgi:hypothetical protein
MGFWTLCDSCHGSALKEFWALWDNILNVCIFITFAMLMLLSRSRVSSGSIVSGYGLDDRTIGVQSPVGVKDFSSYHLCPYRIWGPPSLLYNGYRG